MSETLLIVGGGFGQMPAILVAKKMGVRTIVVDRDRNAPGMAIADQSEQLDIVDIPAVVALAKANNVKGVLTLQSDIGVPTVGAVVDELGLPGAGYRAANCCSDKILCRSAFERENVPQPRFEVANSLEQAMRGALKMGFPCVFKAPDSSGSRGVVKVNSEEDIECSFRASMEYSRSGRIIVEEFIEGLEVGAQAFSVGGRCERVLVHNDTLSPKPYMIPVGHSFPAQLSEKQLMLVEEAVARCLHALGISDGPSNIDLIITPQGQPKIIEVGARIGATCLPELVEHFSGIDWVGCAIEIALGRKPDLTLKRQQPCAALILESPSDGLLESVRIPATFRDDACILEIEVTAKSGEKVSKLRKGTDRIGKVITKAESAGEAEAKALALKRLIEFKIAAQC